MHRPCVGKFQAHQNQDITILRACHMTSIEARHECIVQQRHTLLAAPASSAILAKARVGASGLNTPCCKAAGALTRSLGLYFISSLQIGSGDYASALHAQQSTQSGMILHDGCPCTTRCFQQPTQEWGICSGRICAMTAILCMMWTGQFNC